MSSLSRNRSKQFGASVNVDESHLESLNESMAESLSSKVSQLKSIAIDLEGETRDHMPLLDGLDDGMEGGNFRLSDTMTRLNLMARSHGLSGRKLTFTVALGLLALLFLIYIYMSR